MDIQVEVVLFTKKYTNNIKPELNYDFMITDKKMYLTVSFTVEIDKNESYVDNRLLTCTCDNDRDNKMLYTASHNNLPDDFNLTKEGYETEFIELNYQFNSFIIERDCIYDIYYLFISKCVEKYKLKILENDVKKFYDDRKKFYDDRKKFYDDRKKYYVAFISTTLFLLLIYNF